MHIVKYISIDLQYRSLSSNLVWEWNLELPLLESHATLAQVYERSMANERVFELFEGRGYLSCY